MLNASGLADLNAAMRQAAEGLGRAAAAFKVFADAAAEFTARMWNDAQFLRAFDGGWPKKHRRRVGRRIRKLERISQAGA